MSNFHISSKGLPAHCSAQPGNCPLKEDDGKPMPHFYDKETAYQYIELKAEADAYNSGYDHSLQKSDSEKQLEEKIEEEEVSEDKISPEKTVAKKPASKKKTVAVKVSPKDDGIDHEPGVVEKSISKAKLKKLEEKQEKDEKIALVKSKKILTDDDLQYLTYKDFVSGPKEMESDKEGYKKLIYGFSTYAKGKPIIRYEKFPPKGLDDPEGYSVSEKKEKSNNAFYHSEVKGVHIDSGYFSSKKISGHIIGKELSDEDIRNLGFEDFEKNHHGHTVLAERRRIGTDLEDHIALSEFEMENTSQIEKNAIHTFTSGSYTEINDSLYSGQLFAKEVEWSKAELNENLNGWEDSEYDNFRNLKQVTDNIDSALEKSPKKHRIVYRGASPQNWPSSDGKNLNEILENDFKPGSTIGFKGFQSTTSQAGEHVFSGDVVFEIATPEGLNISSSSKYEDEKEILLPREQKYVVVSSHKDVLVGWEKRTVVRMVAVNSKGEILDGTNSDPIEPIKENDFKYKK